MSLRILCIGGPYLTSALNRLGHRTFTVHPGAHADLPTPHPYAVRQLQHRLEAAGFMPDALFYCDDGNMPQLLDPQNVPWPAVRYSIDTYCNPWHIPYSWGFDATLVAQKDYVELFSQEGMTAQWFPLFCPQFSPTESDFAERDIPVSFVGTLGHKNNPDREPFLKAFRAQHPLVMLSGNYRPIFERSRIALNQTAASEVNFRCFEAISCGAALLMETCGNGLEELFALEHEILPTFARNNARAAAAIAARALSQPQWLAEVASAGSRAVRQRHTDTVRAVRLTQILAELCANHAHKERLEQSLEKRSTLIRAAYGMLASEITDPNLQEHREFFKKLCLREI
jgi:hypothetical protein